jgi:nitrite reductase (cytochrome c-552)
MPYTSQGGVKYTDHNIRSPLANVAGTCGVCHRMSEQEAISRVESTQDKNRDMLDMAESALVAAHTEVGQAIKSGASAAKLKQARALLRRAQMRWDFVAASNGMGVHTPQECARILASAINLAQEARLSIAGQR